MWWQGFQAALLLVAAVAVWGMNPLVRLRYRQIPGPAPDPFLGNLKQIMQMGGFHVALLKWARQYGRIFKIFLGRNLVVVVSDPEVVHTVCVKDFQTFPGRGISPLTLFVGDSESAGPANLGVITVWGKYWAGLRSAFMPLFQTDSLAAYAPDVNAAAAKLASRCMEGGPAGSSRVARSTATRANTDKPEPSVTSRRTLAKRAADVGNVADLASAPFNISEALADYAMEVVGSTAFGVDFSAEAQGGSRITREAQLAFGAVIQGSHSLLRAAVLIVPGWRRLWAWLGPMLDRGLPRAYLAMGYLLGSSQALLGASRGDLPPDGEQPQRIGGTAATAPFAPSSVESDYLQGKREGFLDYRAAVPHDRSLIHRLASSTDKTSGEQLNDAQILAQCVVFLIAGHHTTSTVLSHVVYAIATMPEIETRVLAEVDTLGVDDFELGYKDLDRFPYTLAVLQEAMRMWAPVMPAGVLRRSCVADTSLAGKRIPAGTQIWLNVLAVHHDPALYPDPEVFRPERFMPGSAEAEGRHPCAFFPFGVGPRRCVGEKLAMQEVMTALVQLYRRYVFRLDPTHHPGAPQGLKRRLVSAAVLSEAGGVWVTAHMRK